MPRPGRGRHGRSTGWRRGCTVATSCPRRAAQSRSRVQRSGSLGVVVRPVRRPIGWCRSRTARGARGAASARCGSGRRPIEVRRRTWSAARRGGRSDRPATRSQVDRRARPPALLAAASRPVHPRRQGSPLDANMVSHHRLPPAHPLGAGRPALSGTDQAGSVGQLPSSRGGSSAPGGTPRPKASRTNRAATGILLIPSANRHDPGPARRMGTQPRIVIGRRAVNATANTHSRGHDPALPAKSAHGPWPRGYRPPRWIGTCPTSPPVAHVGASVIAEVDAEPAATCSG